MKLASLDDVIARFGCAPDCHEWHGGAGPLDGGHRYSYDHHGSSRTFAYDGERVSLTPGAYARRLALVRSGQQNLGLEG